MAASALVIAPLAGPANADSATLPDVLSTDAVNTSTVAIHVPRGVTPRAISMVLNQPEIVSGGLVALSINGRVVKTVASTLYKKVILPVTLADVTAQGTIGLGVRSTGPAIDNVCRPDAGSATLRKVTLRYDGAEAAPTTLASFFPPASTRLDVLIDTSADAAVQQAALVAIAALSSKYPRGTDIRLTTTDKAPTRGVATQRAILLQTGRPAEVLTEVSTAANGVPTLTITGTGDDLASAARAIALAEPGDPLLNNPSLSDLTAQIEPRTPNLEQTFSDITNEEIGLAGFGVLAQRVRIPQDVFGSQVSALDVHLEGTTSAITDADLARVDVRLNDDLVGSQSLRPDGRLVLDFTVPAGGLRSVNELLIQLSAVTPQGAPCAGVGVPPVEVTIDSDRSTITASPGAGGARGFQQLPQALQGTVPLAIATADDSGRAPQGDLQDAASLVVALQEAAAFPLDIQVIAAEVLLAGERSGILVGAGTDEAATLRAPLRLSSIRELDRPDSTLQITSEEPFAVLEAFTSDDRQILMLGGWAPDGGTPPKRFSRSIADQVSTLGWAALDGDLLLTDGNDEPFLVDSRTLAAESEPLVEPEEENTYAKWFILGALLLLLLGAGQVALVVRRDRRFSHSIDDYLSDDRDDLGVLPD